MAVRDKISPLYGYIAIKKDGIDPDVCKAGMSTDPINRPEDTWSTEGWVVIVAFIISSHAVETEWKQELKQHRVGTGGTEMFSLRPMMEIALQYQRENLLANVKLISPIEVVNGPKSIDRVTVEVAQPPTAQPVRTAGKISPYSTEPAPAPISPYARVQATKGRIQWQQPTS